MIFDKFTKFSLSILVFSLCLNALNPWLSPTLANAEIEDTEVKNAIKIIAQGMDRIASVYEKLELLSIRLEQRDLMRYQKQEQRIQRAEQRTIRNEQRKLMQRAQGVRAAQKLRLEDTNN